MVYVDLMKFPREIMDFEGMGQGVVMFEDINEMYYHDSLDCSCFSLISIFVNETNLESQSLLQGFGGELAEIIGKNHNIDESAEGFISSMHPTRCPTPWQVSL